MLVLAVDEMRARDTLAVKVELLSAEAVRRNGLRSEPQSVRVSAHIVASRSVEIRRILDS